jgi:hypothetical protein
MGEDGGDRGDAQISDMTKELDKTTIKLNGVIMDKMK